MWACGRSNSMHSLLCKVVYLESIFMMTGRNYFRSFVEQIFTLFFQNTEFFSKYKLHLFDPPVYEIECFIIDHFMGKSALFSFKCQTYFESSFI